MVNGWMDEGWIGGWMRMDMWVDESEWWMDEGG